MQPTLVQHSCQLRLLPHDHHHEKHPQFPDLCLTLCSPNSWDFGLTTETNNFVHHS